MIDLARLTEALAVLDDPPNGDGRWQSDLAVGAAIHIAIDAARLVAAGQPLSFCAFHVAAGDGSLDCWGAGLDGQDSCRMVEGVWVPTGKDET